MTIETEKITVASLPISEYDGSSGVVDETGREITNGQLILDIYAHQGFRVWVEPGGVVRRASNGEATDPATKGRLAKVAILAIHAERPVDYGLRPDLTSKV